MTNTTTQSFVPIKEIQNGIIIRDDGVLCGIIMVRAINFELKSETERNAILYQFQALLNSLEVSVQLLIQSRKLNIKPYILFLENIREKHRNELMRMQIKEYIKFITHFTDMNDIMTKDFYVVTTYSPISGSSGGFSSFFGKGPSVKEKQFEENRAQLLQRMSFIQNNVRSLGLDSVLLGTEEVTELIYQTFNPGDTQVPTV